MKGKTGKGKLNERHREVIAGYLFLVPGLLYMLLMIGYPIIYNMILSFQDMTAYNIKSGDFSFIGIDNYAQVFRSPTMPHALPNTFKFTLISITIQFTIGLLFALLFSKKFFLAKPVRGFLVISWMMPATVIALLFKYMLSPDAGIIDNVLLMMGVIQEPIGWLLRQETALYGPIMANIWVGIPFNMLLLSTGLNNIPEEVYESASIDGAGPLSRFFRITLPLLRPAMMSVLILGFVYTFKVFDLIYVMTGGGPVYATEVLSTFSYKLSFVNYNFSQGAAAANVLFFCLFLVALVYLRLIGKEEAS